jgi:hypothetical protein
MAFIEHADGAAIQNLLLPGAQQDSLRPFSSVNAR